jgi:hypothetical protein
MRAVVEAKKPRLVACATCRVVALLLLPLLLVLICTRVPSLSIQTLVHVSSEMTDHAVPRGTGRYGRVIAGNAEALSVCRCAGLSSCYLHTLKTLGRVVRLPVLGGEW